MSSVGRFRAAERIQPRLDGAKASVSIAKTEEEQKKQLNFSVYASGAVLKSYFDCPIVAKDLKGVVVGPVLAELNEPVVRMLLTDRRMHLIGP